MKKWIIIALMLLTALAHAETMPEITPAPEVGQEEQQLFDSETLAAHMEAMFAAAAGTSFETETALREALTEEPEATSDPETETAEQKILARNEEMAAYRAMTLPWLKAALAPAPDPEIEPAPSPTPSPAPTLSAEEAAAEMPVFTIEDSFAAFEQNDFGKAYLEFLAPMGGTDMETCLNLSRELAALWMAEVDHAALEEMNPHYTCWIYMPASQIDYPVVQCEDNSYYLNRMFNGARNAAGTLFIDYRNLPEFMDPNTLIYGHHMRNDSMFGSLTEYYQQAYFESHPYIMVMMENERFLLEVFAGYTTTEKDHCYDIAISDEDDMAAFLAEAFRKSDFVSSVPVDSSDTLTTLSTCAYVVENARYVLMGRILPVWEAAGESVPALY